MESLPARAPSLLREKGTLESLRRKMEMEYRNTNKEEDAFAEPITTSLGSKKEWETLEREGVGEAQQKEPSPLEGIKNLAIKGETLGGKALKEGAGYRDREEAVRRGGKEAGGQYKVGEERDRSRSSQGKKEGKGPSSEMGIYMDGRILGRTNLRYE